MSTYAANQDPRLLRAGFYGTPSAPNFAVPADVRLARRGVRIAIPSNKPATKTPPPSVIPEQLPRFLTLSFGFFGTAAQGAGSAGITVPAGFNAGTNSAWYPLLDLDPREKLGQQVGLFAVAGSLLPTGYNASAGSANDVNWGSVQGCKAGIVVGSGLPIVSGAWNIAPCSLPGIQGEGALTDPSTLYYWWTTFPPGSFTDNPPLKGFAFESFAPYLTDIPTGKRLQAALVVRGLVNGGGTPLNLCGGASLRAMVGQTQPVGGFQAFTNRG